MRARQGCFVCVAAGQHECFVLVVSGFLLTEETSQR